MYVCVGNLSARPKHHITHDHRSLVTFPLPWPRFTSGH